MNEEGFRGKKNIWIGFCDIVDLFQKRDKTTWIRLYSKYDKAT